MIPKMIMSALLSIVGFTGNILMFDSLKREIDGRIREAMNKAVLCAAILFVFIIVSLVLSGINLKGNNDIRDEVRSRQESLQSEMKALAEENDEARAEREALQSEIRALAEEIDEARTEHEARQSEIRKLSWMMYGLMAVCVVAIVLVVFDTTRIRKLEHRISELEQKPDDPLLAPGKRIHHLRVLPDSDSQTARRTEGSTPAHQEKTR